MDLQVFLRLSEIRMQKHPRLANEIVYKFVAGGREATKVFTLCILMRYLNYMIYTLDGATKQRT